MNHNQDLEEWYRVMLDHQWIFNEIPNKEEIYMQRKVGWVSNGVYYTWELK